MWGCSGPSYPFSEVTGFEFHVFRVSSCVVKHRGIRLRDAMGHWLLYTERVLVGVHSGMLYEVVKRHHRWISDVVIICHLIIDQKTYFCNIISSGTCRIVPCPPDHTICWTFYPGTSFHVQSRPNPSTRSHF